MPAAASNRITSPSSIRSLRRILRSSSSLARSPTADSPLAMTSSASTLASAMNCSLEATKSVSLFSLTIAPTLPLITRATTPWLFSRSSRLALAARPFSRNHCFAASMSPLLVSRAFLQSIIPAPVAWRSACTSFAVNDIVVTPPSAGRRPMRHGRHGRPGLLRPTCVRPPAARRTRPAPPPCA